jgi:hypothetical protein
MIVIVQLEDGEIINTCIISSVYIVFLYEKYFIVSIKSLTSGSLIITVKKNDK